MGIKYAFKLLELNKITATKFKSTLKMILAIWNSLIKGGLLVTKKMIWQLYFLAECTFYQISGTFLW